MRSLGAGGGSWNINELQQFLEGIEALFFLYDKHNYITYVLDIFRISEDRYICKGCNQYRMFYGIVFQLHGELGNALNYATDPFVEAVCACVCVCVCISHSEFQDRLKILP